ncbi:MAG: UvrD-helicase domain-containing protein [Prevotellaceae bacterium]|jgi:DNA helicase-2/ATP-dependent DNA helicase PcrA|nr:UvrD-helicase domain-containing protein [Prevotellaceae bacterium]
MNTAELNFNFKELLNEQQYAAVLCCDSPSVVVAGAGSGKTRVLTYKIAYLLQQGYCASSILALTFTNKAAREMKDRIVKITGTDIARGLWMGTFHSIFLRILLQNAEVAGYQPNFTIYDTDDTKSLIKHIIKEMELDEKLYKPRGVFARISSMKNSLITPSSYAAQPDLIQADKYRHQPHFAEIYALYVDRCKQANAMDFDDLLLNTYLLFKQNPTILEYYQDCFLYILVDEYQDTNIVQHQIITLLAAKHRRVCVVGDDAQSIYSFRGANIDNILSFQRSYTECKLFRLEENYRSTQTIVNAANSLIEKNKHQIPKRIFSKLSTGDPIRVLSCFSDLDEGRSVSDEIKNLVEKKQLPCGNIAVLYRTNAQSRIFEDALRKQNIPYKIYGGHSFYQRKEIKDALAYMRLVINSDDDEALRRIINYPLRGIGAVTFQKIFAAAKAGHTSVMNMLLNDKTALDTISRNMALKIQAFVNMIVALADFNAANDAFQTAERILTDSGIMEDIAGSDDPDNISRRENIWELLNAIHEFCEQREYDDDGKKQLADFLSEVSLLTDQDTNISDDQQRVTLMTVHAAKGLEFQYIFIVGMEEELFPSVMCLSEKDLEEERRLFYVALTRAKESCIITYAKSRFRSGKMVMPQPSRFLNDIDQSFLQMPLTFFHHRNKQDYSPVGKHHFPDSASGNAATFKPLDDIKKEYPSRSDVAGEFNVGDTVEHLTFGRGIVLALESDAGQTKVRVNFGANGVRLLLMKYARLKKI